MKKKILITGGAGYIGSKLAYDLLDLKKDIIIVDNLSTGSRNLIPKKAKFYKVDLNNSLKLKKIFQNNNIETIFHMAACTDVLESERNPSKYYLNNVEATRILLEVSKNKVKNFIFSSTCALYDIEKKNIVSEKDHVLPKGVYGLTKYLSEKLVLNYSSTYKFNYAILRYFNVAGCDEKNRTGFVKRGPLFNNIAKNLAQNKSEINIYGNKFPTNDGTAIRDYIFIEDLVKYHIEILNKVKKKSYLLNLGYGKGFSVNEVVKEFQKYHNKKIKKNYLKQREGEISKIICNNKKLKSVIKQKIPKDVLNKMVATSLSWAKKQKMSQ